MDWLFRRGRLRAKEARARLIELFDQRYQWALRIPIVRLLARGDPARFVCSLRFLVGYVGQGVYLLNRQRPPEQVPWFDDDLEAAVADLAVKPTGLVERLTAVMRLEDPIVAEREARRLLLEIIELVPREKKRGEEEEQPVVSWLPHVADFELVPEPSESPEDHLDYLMRLARRAVRIVWRLPGSRLAALSGSVAANYADLISDVDITLFGLKLPDPRVRRSLLAATTDNPDDITVISHPNYAADAFWLASRLIDVRYYLIEEARRLIEHPVPQSRSDYELLAHLSTAEILVDYEFRGPDLQGDLRRATRRAREERMARAAARLEGAVVRLESEADSPAIFYDTVEAVLALFQLLAARNDRWIVFPKWTSDWLDDLTHAPAETHQRLSDVVLLPSSPENVPLKVKTLRALAREVQAL